MRLMAVRGKLEMVLPGEVLERDERPSGSPGRGGPHGVPAASTSDGSTRRPHGLMGYHREARRN